MIDRSLLKKITPNIEVLLCIVNEPINENLLHTIDYLCDGSLRDKKTIPQLFYTQNFGKSLMIILCKSKNNHPWTFLIENKKVHEINFNNLALP